MLALRIWRRSLSSSAPSALKNLEKEGIRILGPVSREHEEILTPDAVRFVAALSRKFRPTRDKLLAARSDREQRLLSGEKPRFLPETAHIRAGDWRVRPAPKDLQDRRVEITGPVSAKMVINALNTNASCFMADFEDSNAPCWGNNLDGQRNLKAAVRRELSWVQPSDGKKYQLNPKYTPTLLVRPRGWHLDEKGMLVDNERVPGGLFDFGLYLFHNHEETKLRGTGAYFYLPKLESHLEARLWSEVFDFARKELNVKTDICVTVLIETILASFEMDEILYELRNYITGLNCGRWDYIFSFIKKFRNDPKYGHLPDRSQILMTQPFMSAYVDLLIQTCHKRHAHAMGGMAAQIPIANNPAESEIQLRKVREDKIREVTAGHDGTWVAHPGLIPIAKEVFDNAMPQANQIQTRSPTRKVTEEDLLRVPEGTITEDGVKHNAVVGALYLEAWLRGNGCVPLFNLMEDAATAEISRSQIWLWVHHKAKTTSGVAITAEYVRSVLDKEFAELRHQLGEVAWEEGRYDLAKDLFARVALAESFPQFLTSTAYDYIE